jgi:hypothetical protein
MLDLHSLNFFSVLSFLTPFVIAIGQNTSIAFAPSPTAFKLASADSPVTIIIDSGEWPAVLNAAENLGSDFGLVTGRNATLQLLGKRNTTINSISSIWNTKKWTAFNGKHLSANTGVILAGTLGASPLIDEWIRQGKLDARSLKDGWETFISSYVDNPVAGIDRALVIAGEFFASLSSA